MTKEKLQYIFDYYKFHILFLSLFILFLISILRPSISKKEDIFYCGLVNVTISPELENSLTTEYLQESDYNKKKQTITLYHDLLISESIESDYADVSRLKIIAAINAKQLDLVIMNKESYDYFSYNDYLLDLQPYEVSYPNIVLATNQVLNKETPETSWITVPNAFEVSNTTYFSNFQDKVYIGIIKNTPRMKELEKYLSFLLK